MRSLSSMEGNVRSQTNLSRNHLEALRGAIATYLRTSRAVLCEAEQIMIVRGSQQALDITTRVLLDAGAVVWVEEPGYWLVHHVLKAAGCRARSRRPRGRLWLYALSLTYVGEAARRGFVLGFGNTRASEMPGVIQLLKRLLKHKKDRRR
jgi:histidinol-phosphate/aromatic aminotransferase/cobyric acid decarboxylase-like protein